MSKIWRVLTSVRFLNIFVIPNVAFLLLAWATDAAFLIPILNLIVLALGTGVCVAYTPHAIEIMVDKERPMDKADLLTLGILSSWFSLELRTIFSVVWRFMNMPSWMVNTDFTSYFVFMVACAGVYHLAAPGALNDTIPPRRWIMIGILASCGVFAGLMILYLANIQAIIQIGLGPHDLVIPPIFKHLRPGQT